MTLREFLMRIDRLLADNEDILDNKVLIRNSNMSRDFDVETLIEDNNSRDLIIVIE